MCRSIKTLRKEPEYGDEDIQAAALQYVRKLSGYRAPATRNAEVFDEAVSEITQATKKLLERLQ